MTVISLEPVQSNKLEAPIQYVGRLTQPPEDVVWEILKVACQINTLYPA